MAQQLEWNPHQFLLTMVIRPGRLSLALAGHPARASSGIKRLPDFEQLSPQMLQYPDICGIVVEWPITRNGVVGAQCGRVLHALDAMTIDIPVCLHTTQTIEHKEDAWGRVARYGQPAPADKTCHIASLEQYGLVSSSVCVIQDVWKTYAMRYWPMHINDNVVKPSSSSSKETTTTHTKLVTMPRPIENERPTRTLLHFVP